MIQNYTTLWAYSVNWYFSHCYNIVWLHSHRTFFFLILEEIPKFSRICHFGGFLLPKGSQYCKMLLVKCVFYYIREIQCFRNRGIFDTSVPGKEPIWARNVFLNLTGSLLVLRVLGKRKSQLQCWTQHLDMCIKFKTEFDEMVQPKKSWV